MQTVIFKSNCLFFALKKYLKHGGYLIIRKSRLGGILPHVLWSPDLIALEHFQPTDPKPMLLPPLFFEGYVKTHDRIDNPDLTPLE